MPRRMVLAALAAAAGLLAAGCTGVPGTSAPQVVGQLGGAAPAGTPSGPPPGAQPREVVSQFLGEDAAGDPTRRVAQSFFTHAGYQRWSPTKVTIVDQVTVSNLSAGEVFVSGREIGTIGPGGIYQPGNLAGAGGGGDQVRVGYGMVDVPGQGWRIDTIRPATSPTIIIDAEQFQTLYQQRSLYFFDSTERHLVADPRYTALTDQALLGNWLVSELAAGPRPELQSATGTELPGQAQDDPTKVTVTLGTPAQVQVPGAAQLDAGTRNRLAAQLAFTLDPVAAGEVQIVDAGRPVPVPAAGLAFTTANFLEASQPATDTPTLYYLNEGHILSIDGSAVAPHATSAYSFTQAALARTGAGDLRIAGTYGTGRQAQFAVGTAATGMHRVDGVRGDLSRPTWAPFLDEVWVGAGSTLYRVPLQGKPTPVPIAAPNGSPVPGDVLAVRFSPDGGRVALVLQSPSGGQLWVGGVSRGQGASGQVQVTGAVPITPQGVTVLDAAWNGELTLFAIGRPATSNLTGVYEVQVDGSLLTARGTAGLPGAPDSITVAENQVAWVSVGGTIWQQEGNSWGSPGGDLRGTNPVYLE